MMNIKHILAIASAKGGVGKSTIAANLAISLSEDYKVGILDADIYGPSQHLLFNIENSKPESFEINGQKKLKPIVSQNIKINSMGFMMVADQAVIWRGPMLSNALKQIIQVTAWDDLDFLIVDMPPGTGDSYLTVAKEIKPSAAILITTSHILSLSDTERSKIAFQKLGVPILGYINNMTGEICPKCFVPLDTHIHANNNFLKDINCLGTIPRSLALQSLPSFESALAFKEVKENVTKLFL